MFSYQSHKKGKRLDRMRFFCWQNFSLFSLIFVFITGCAGSSSNSPTAKLTATATSGSSSPTATATAVAATPAGDWYTYHYDQKRTGYVQTAPDAQQFTKAWNVKLDGAVYAEPLVVKGNVIVATENDTLYALSPDNGSVIWQRNVGKPVKQSTLPCGDIDPLGITGTPVYDPATGLIFAVAEIEGPQHILIGIDASNGEVKLRRVVDIAEMEIKVHQQRAALALGNGMVYIAYGGLAGDCGNYKGTIIASRTDGTGNLLSYRIPTGREGGIWAPAGPAIDDQGKVYVAVGNGESTSGSWDHSDSVLRLSADLKLEDGFAPTEWADENSRDADLGSMGPLLLPDKLIFIAGKASTGFLLHANALHGVGGEIARANVCSSQSMGGGAVVGLQILDPCRSGIRSFTVVNGSKLQASWTNSSITQSPIVGNHTVYGFDDGGTLYAVDLTSGVVRTKIALSATLPHFATPTLSNNHIFVGTMNGVLAVTLA